jgi:hypothetical protein
MPRRADRFSPAGVEPVERVPDTFAKGFRTLCGKGWRVCSVDMKHEMPAGPGGNVAVDGGFVDLVGRSQPVFGRHSLSQPARTQVQDRSPQLAHTKTPRQFHDRERPERTPSATTPAHDGRDLIHDRDTELRIPNPRRHPQITHARATQLPMSTCRQENS